jgi:hypothetical protein
MLMQYTFLIFLLGDVIGDGGNLHIRVGIEPEVPETAQLLGKGRRHRRVVQVDHQVVRVALIVLVHRFDQGTGHRGTVALGDDVDALVQGIPELDEDSAGLVLLSKGHDLKLFAAQHPSLGVDQFGHVLKWR